MNLQIVNEKKSKKKFSTDWPKKDTKFQIHMSQNHDMIMRPAIAREDRTNFDYLKFLRHAPKSGQAVKRNSATGNQAHLSELSS